MADKRVKYIDDDGPFCEVGITGRQTSWRKNQSGYVTEANALLLVSSGKFVLSSTSLGTDTDSLDVHKLEHRDIGGVPRQVAVSGIPFLIPPGDGASSGLQFTGSAGAFTLSSAILTNLWNGLKGCWMYVPASFGGSAYPSGWYWAEFSSDTAGILYTNTYTSGLPVRPAAPTAFPANLSGWLTTTTSEITGPTGFVLPGGSMGKNGSLKSHCRAYGNVTGNKFFRMYVGSTLVMAIVPTTLPNNEFLFSVRNQGVENLQVGSRGGARSTVGVNTADGSAFTSEFMTIDTSADKTISYSLQLSSNQGCAVLAGFDTICTYGA